ncbi:hypothetical protein ABL78_2768 [Leptomonas seymouri]|uniref:Uncharacterized protein n=1 Tax=Leptomonas seymouri TaxID=5684 RepID=A0A0N1PF55_LEPSE|nr:hypothetical protein ABL78_2768 [Leptomonas seymouri]|eukprot:KPI88135.1 hypothetical protein ABL78_2768 [Leptomonas seymouri]
MRHTRAHQRAATLSSSPHRAALYAASLSRLAVPAVRHRDSTHPGSMRSRRSTDIRCLSFTSTSHAPWCSLQCSRATIKSRSLPPDDPFGEKSSWEDPSDGLYSAWNDVDQEGFANATQSAEVRNAHFGPEWARFTTVGRMSVKKMKEAQAAQPHPPPSTEGADGEPASTAASAAQTRYPSAEELHEAELKAKRRLLQRNYMSYEAFIEHELGAGEGFAEGASRLTMEGSGAGENLYSAASMESAFSAVEGVGSRDRMSQRNVEREALETIEAAEVEETLPLPNFVFEGDTQIGSPAGAAELPAAFASASGQEGIADDKAVEAEGMPTATSASPHTTQTIASPTPLTRPSRSSSVSSSSIPTPVVHQVLRALGSPHGDARIPLTDPMHWGTEDIIHYLTLMEQRPVDVDAATPRDSWTVMDETMCDTFRMAKATGDTLLNVVVPPRLFRLMRRWHVRRQDVVNKAWMQYQEKFGPAVSMDPPSATSSAQGAAVSQISDEVVAAAVAENLARLDEAVQPLDHILIQETILLCFPYGR